MGTSRRGFASMDASKQREIASKGGRAAHAKGTAHEFTTDEARIAGRKGGEAVSRDREHMAAIGREGGHSRGARARERSTIPAIAHSGRSDVAQGVGSRPFVGEAREQRQPFEPLPNRETSREPAGYTSQERPGSARSERPSEIAREGLPLPSRDRL
jgi:uncharacterized protein